MSSQAHTEATNKPDHVGTSHEYVLNRNYASGARLNLQHYLLKQSIGYNLHPSIPINADTKIADIATGTGIWLLDLSFNIPPTVQLRGFDISADQFPPASSLPSNINFDTFDVTASVPEHLVGQFDIVHVGVLIAVIENNFSTWLTNVLKLLKPGGYIQWNEADFSGFAQRTMANPPSGEEFPGLAALAKLSAAVADQGSDMKGWLRGMDWEFKEAGLELVEFRAVEPPTRLARAMSENTLLAVGEIAAKRGRSDVLEMLATCGEDLKKGGLYMGCVPVVAVGRKPEWGMLQIIGPGIADVPGLLTGLLSE